MLFGIYGMLVAMYRRELVVMHFPNIFTSMEYSKCNRKQSSAVTTFINSNRSPELIICSMYTIILTTISLDAKQLLQVVNVMHLN